MADGTLIRKAIDWLWRFIKRKDLERNFKKLGEEAHRVEDAFDKRGKKE